MNFVQIASFHASDLDGFKEREEEWQRQTEGRRTLRRWQLLADHNDPTHFVSVNWFDSYESAMVNSALPETDAMAQWMAAKVTGQVEFTNLDAIGGHDTDAGLAAASLRRLFETNERPDGLVADDVDFTLVIPGGQLRGDAAYLMEVLAGDAASREFSVYACTPTPDGFVAEYTYRAIRDHGEVHINVGLVLAEVKEGRITRLSMSCAGNWTEEKADQVVAATGAFGPRHEVLA
jgi:hypothetical protein